MTTSAMGKLLESYLTELEGENGFWRGSRDDVPVFVFSDDEHDRMRLMAPIGVVEELDSELLHVLLQANYDRALDARYAMRNKELWAVVVHPLATLATDDLPSLFDQVVMLVKNTGTTFSSTELVFRSFPDDVAALLEHHDPPRADRDEWTGHRHRGEERSGSSIDQAEIGEAFDVFERAVVFPHLGSAKRHAAVGGELALRDRNDEAIDVMGHEGLLFDVNQMGGGTKGPS